MIKRIIFDIDGTLIRNVNFNKAIINTLLEFDMYSDNNLDIFLKSIKTYEQYHNGYNKKDYLNYFSEQLNVRLDEDFLKCFFANLRYTIPNDSKEIIETLSYLSTKYELVLLSNYFEESQRNRLKEMGIDTFFKEYYGQDKIKPFTETYLSACGKYSPQECVIIGDDFQLDINIPKTLGFNTIWMHEEEQTISDIKIIKKIKELKGVL